MPEVVVTLFFVCFAESTRNEDVYKIVIHRFLRILK